MLNYDITYVSPDGPAPYLDADGKAVMRIYAATSLLDAVTRFQAANPGMRVTKAQEAVLQ